MTANTTQAERAIRQRRAGVFTCTESDGGVDDDGAQHGFRQSGEEPCEEQQGDDGQTGATAIRLSWVFCPASSATLVLLRLPETGKPPRIAEPRVRTAQRDEFLVGAGLHAVSRGHRVHCGDRFAEAHEDDGEGADGSRAAPLLQSRGRWAVPGWGRPEGKDADDLRPRAICRPEQRHRRSMPSTTATIARGSRGTKKRARPAGT